MAFIRAQKVVRDKTGKIISGSAAIVDVKYIPEGKYHSKQVVREKLGKVISLSDDRKIGVFMSPTRGLIEYNSTTDQFSPVDRGDERVDDETLFPEPQVHTVFGDVYLLLSNMRSTGMTSLLRDVFTSDEEYERVIAHQTHAVLKDGSHISCDLFTARSFLSYLISDIPIDTLYSDTQYFSFMGDDRVKVGFFRKYIKLMRRKNPRFGKGCFLDSTPLPNDIKDNPFNRLCSHGLKGADVQMRLALILDEESGKPVWYEIIPGNLLDINTLRPMLDQLESTLDISVDSLVLDAGYVSKDLIEEFNSNTYDQTSDDGRRMIARMPDKNGYPFDELYYSNCKMFPNAKYTFIRNGRRYFGIRREVTVFGFREYAYVYLDFDNALWKFEKYVLNHEVEYNALSDKAKTRKTYEFGFFVLISNVEMSPGKALDWYFERTDIEEFFKTAKEYLDLLPISKWTDCTVRGKILSDIISVIIYKDLRFSAHRAETSVSRTIGATQSLMCTRNGDHVIVESPNKQVKDIYVGMGVKVPTSLSVEHFKDEYLQL